MYHQTNPKGNWTIAQMHRVGKWKNEIETIFSSSRLTGADNFSPTYSVIVQTFLLLRFEVNWANSLLILIWNCSWPKTEHLLRKYQINIRDFFTKCKFFTSKYCTKTGKVFAVSVLSLLKLSDTYNCGLQRLFMATFTTTTTTVSPAISYFNSFETVRGIKCSDNWFTFDLIGHALPDFTSCSYNSRKQKSLIIIYFFRTREKFFPVHTPPAHYFVSFFPISASLFGYWWIMVFTTNTPPLHQSSSRG